VRFRTGAALERPGTLTDLSLEGGFVETSMSPAEGSDVLVVISTPTAWEPLSIPGEVRWIREAPTEEGGEGFGVRFGALTSEQAAALYELLETTRAWEMER
jgi:Tfp pilus assembly protein PilZ